MPSSDASHASSFTVVATNTLLATKNRRLSANGLSPEPNGTRGSIAPSSHRFSFYRGEDRTVLFPPPPMMPIPSTPSNASTASSVDRYDVLEYEYFREKSDRSTRAATETFLKPREPSRTPSNECRETSGEEELDILSQLAASREHSSFHSSVFGDVESSVFQSIEEDIFSESTGSSTQQSTDFQGSLDVSEQSASLGTSTEEGTYTTGTTYSTDITRDEESFITQEESTLTQGESLLTMSRDDGMHTMTSGITYDTQAYDGDGDDEESRSKVVEEDDHDDDYVLNPLEGNMSSNVNLLLASMSLDGRSGIDTATDPGIFIVRSVPTNASVNATFTSYSGSFSHNRSASVSTNRSAGLSSESSAGKIYPEDVVTPLSSVVTAATQGSVSTIDPSTTTGSSRTYSSGYTVDFPSETIEVIRRKPLISPEIRKHISLSNSGSGTESKETNTEIPAFPLTSDIPSPVSTMENVPGDENDNREVREELGNHLVPDLSLVFSSQSQDLESSMGASVTPVARIPYVHGSYASAAPIMLQDRKWMRILRQLMPEAHADAIAMLCREQNAAQTKGSSPKTAKIMKWAENNPIVAAYGILNSDAGKAEQHVNAANNSSSRFTSQRRSRRSRLDLGEKRVSNPVDGGDVNAHTRKLPVLEWDIFLDPTLVKEVEAAMAAAEATHSSPESDVEDQIAAEIEIDRQVGRLIGRMMLAHGSASQLAAEALGVAQQYNFSSLVEECESQRLYRRKVEMKTWERSGMYFSRNGRDCGGKTWLERNGSNTSRVHVPRSSAVPGKTTAITVGIFIERWMRLFAKALALGGDGQLGDLMSFSAEDDELANLDDETVQVPQSLCGMFLCLGYEDPNSLKADHGKTSMAKTAKRIQELLGSPLRVILDLKSRSVSSSVWARLVDNISSRGVIVEGLGSFDIDELREISSKCASRVQQVRFFHSAGDLQKACHADEVKVGDSVYFNAGSLIWTKPSSLSTVCCHAGPRYHEVVLDDLQTSKGVVFQPFAYPTEMVPKLFGELECQSTLQDYKEKFQLNIGCYVQEFSISEGKLDALVQFLNSHTSIYNLGLAWGGLNGRCARGLEGDGYWNQRYMGRSWNPKAEPNDEMKLLHPEDHHLVQKAMRAGAWGHIGTVNNVGEDTPENAAFQLGACATEGGTC